MTCTSRSVSASAFTAVKSSSATSAIATTWCSPRWATPSNVAARLQDMTKTLGCEVVLSDQVRDTADVVADALPEQEVTIRGRAEPMLVRTVVSAQVLATLVEDESIAAA